MHNSIPFLLLGIGIDDMFVIIQNFDNLKPEEYKVGDHAYNIAVAMSHAGSAITVTSLTDFIVFMIGATSTLPALRSFCVYCAIGIIAVYIFQVNQLTTKKCSALIVLFILQATFFVGCLALDLTRIEHGRNGCCFCYKHKNYKFEYKQPTSLTQKLFKQVGDTIMKLPVQIAIMLVTLTLLGIGIWGAVSLEVRFESIWFLPKESYLRLWYETEEVYFPGDGEIATLYMTDLNYPEELDKIENLVSNLSAIPENIKSVSSWYPGLKTYINDAVGVADDGVGVPQEILSLTNFNNYTSMFLFSPDGSKMATKFQDRS